MKKLGGRALSDHSDFQDIFQRIGDDGLDVSVWVKPHRTWGYIKNLWVHFEDGELKVLVMAQSFSHTTASHTNALQSDLPYTQSILDVSQLLPILSKLESFSIPLKPNGKGSQLLGGSYFGITVDWQGFLAERRWYGLVDDVESDLADLWHMIDGLIANP